MQDQSLNIQTLNILVADDHPLFRTAIVQALCDRMNGAQLFEAENWNAVEVSLAQDRQIDLLSLDLCMPGRAGFSGMIFLRSHFPDIPIIIISGIDEPGVIRRTKLLGAAAFIPKTTPLTKMIETINLVLAGGTWFPEDALKHNTAEGEFTSLAKKIGTLTAHQHKVFQLIGDGLLNKQIAYELGLSVSTVKAHTTAILKKLGMQRRTQLLAAMRNLAVESNTHEDLT